LLAHNKKMENVKKSVLLALALFVLLLATGGEFTNNMLKAKTKVVADLHEDDNDDQSTVPTLSFDIFNSVIQVSHLVFHSDLIFEFTLAELSETKAHTIFNTPLHFNEYYKTLFRSIISPNAP